MSKIRLIDIKKSKFDFLLCDKLKKIHNLNKIIYEIKRAQKNKEKVVLSKKVKKEFMKTAKIVEIIEFYEQDKTLYKDYFEEILNIVIQENKLIPEEQTIYFLARKNEIKDRIENMKEKYKLINIVSPNVKEFYNIEDENVIVINNKKKSLKRAKFIVNIDFDEEILKQYFINRDAVILNLSSNKIKNLLGFDGVIINNVRIINDNEVYSMQDMYIANKTNYDIINQKIANRDFALIGNNTVITLTKQ